MNQVPGIFPSFMGSAPGRHSAQTDAVFDDVEQFTIGHSLGAFFPHVWRGRIHMAAHFVLAAPIVRMAGSAVIRPLCSRIGKHFRPVDYPLPLILPPPMPPHTSLRCPAP